MRIVMVCAAYFWGGVETQATRAAHLMMGRGHEVTVIGQPQGKWVERCRAEGIPCVPLPLPRHFSIAGALALGRELDRLAPDAVICYDKYTPRLTATYALLRGGLRQYRRTGPAIVCYCGAPWDFTPAWFTRQIVMPHLDRLVVNSEATRREILEHAWVWPEWVDVIYDGCDTVLIAEADPAGAREELGAAPDDLIAVVAARLAGHKGHRLILPIVAELLPEFPRLRLWIAGTGPEAEAIEAQIDALGLRDRVSMLGFRNDVPRLLKAADLLVHASSHEGAPNAVVEAMSAGLPVVAMGAQGVVEQIVDGETGFVCPVGDTDAMREKLRIVLSDPALRRAMGAAGHERVERVFSKERWVTAWLELLAECVQGRGARTAAGTGPAGAAR
jgi:glycosyltransferase involved in cell wall biosynthesis